MTRTYHEINYESFQSGLIRFFVRENGGQGRESSFVWPLVNGKTAIENIQSSKHFYYGHKKLTAFGTSQTGGYRSLLGWFPKLDWIAVWIFKPRKNPHRRIFLGLFDGHAFTLQMA
jgi:hypothetical protein